VRDRDSSRESDTDSQGVPVSTTKEEVSPEEERVLKELDHSIISGFQLAAASGPLCEEPMFGICFSISDFILYKPAADSVDKYGPFTGQVISTMKEGCRQAYQAGSMRLVEALYDCEVQVSSESLGKVYAVLFKRRAKIANEKMKEGTNDSEEKERRERVEIE